MTRITDTQSRILNRAAARPGHLALPLPEGLHGAAARTVVTRMLDHGWLEEVEAKRIAFHPHLSDPLWRETGDGHGTTLIATAAGLEAIGMNPAVIRTMQAVRNRKDSVPTPKTPRPGTKQAKLIAMLQAPEGASIAEITAAICWEPHSVRGAISGALRKKLGLTITSEKIEGRGRIYKITETV